MKLDVVRRPRMPMEHEHKLLGRQTRWLAQPALAVTEPSRFQVRQADSQAPYLLVVILKFAGGRSLLRTDYLGNQVPGRLLLLP
jgi:hypothetical protein